MPASSVNRRTKLCVVITSGDVGEVGKLAVLGVEIERVFVRGECRQAGNGVVSYRSQHCGETHARE